MNGLAFNLASSSPWVRRPVASRHRRRTLARTRPVLEGVQCDTSLAWDAVTTVLSRQGLTESPPDVLMFREDEGAKTMSAPTAPAQDRSSDKSARRWDKLEKATALVNAIASVIAALAGLYGVFWFIQLPDEHIDSRSAWKVNAGHDRNWRSVDFADGNWGFAVAASPRPSEPTIEGRPLFLMWSPDPSDSDATFRYTFDCSALWLIKGADLYTLSNDDHRVFLNGVLVGVDQDCGAGPLVYFNLKALLRPGKNVIMIEAKNVVGDGYVAVDLTIHRGFVR